MSLPNKTRNKEILKKRKKNSRTWTFAKLGEHYGIDRRTVQKIYKRELARISV